jgi:hypothetical protein
MCRGRLDGAMNKDRIVLGEGFLYETVGGFNLSNNKFRFSGPEPFAHRVTFGLFGLMEPVPRELFYSDARYRVVLEKV